MTLLGFFFFFYIVSFFVTGTFGVMAAATATASTIRYAPEDPNLPKPWKGLVDSRTGYLYFWNPETNVTQYERPPAPVSSSVQAQQQPSSGYSSGKDEDKYSKGSDGPKNDSGSRFSEVLVLYQ